MEVGIKGRSSIESELHYRAQGRTDALRREGTKNGAETVCKLELQMSIKSLLFASAALLALNFSTASAYYPPGGRVDHKIVASLKETYKLGFNFNSEDLLNAATHYEEEALEHESGLKQRFTGADYAEAMADKRIAKERADLGLTPAFTRQDMVRARASQDLASFIRSHNLRPGFTEEDFRRAEGEERAKDEGYSSLVPKRGFDHIYPSDEYAAWSGLNEAAEIAHFYKLAERWTLDDLRAVAGPEEAANIAVTAKIRTDMTHTEIVMALGRKKTREHADMLKIPENYTVDQLVAAYADQAARFAREETGLPDNERLDESNVFAHYMSREDSNLKYLYPELTGNFTEAELKQYFVKTIGEQLRERYDLPDNYSEKDVAAAYAQSLLAQLRRDYGLSSWFTDADLETAVRNLPAEYGRFPQGW
jgi:hypothetical protein